MRVFLILVATLGFLGCTFEEAKIQKIASFKGQQVTGVTVNEQGQIFANFPRWRENVTNSVVEVLDNGQSKAFPNKRWNRWNIGDEINDSVFIAVQSVVAFENSLYVLDTRNPLFNGVLDSPRIFVFDINTATLKRIYTLSAGSFHKDSYINDLRIDKKNGKIYLTDSGHAGLVIVDKLSGETRRVLDNHSSALAETNQLTFSNGVWKNTVHSDGIALDSQNEVLYFHALTGYNLYAISTKTLLTASKTDIEQSVQLVSKTSAPDGMIIDNSGNLFFADLEHNKIMKLDIATGEISVLAEGEKIKWADTFSIYNKELYFTNSRINEAKGDISEMEFSINKVRIY